MMEVQNYLRPKTIEEAYQALLASPNNHVLGGGAWIKLTLKSVDTLIELEDVVSHNITKTSTGIVIGAMATLREIEQSPILANYLDGYLCHVVNQIMGVAVRNVATIGGTVVGAYAFSDLLTALVALDAKLLFHKNGRVSLSESFNYASERDILTSIELPFLNEKAYFHKISRTSLDFAILNVAVVQHSLGFRIIVGSRPGGPVSAIRAENYLKNLGTIKNEDILHAAQLASEELAFGSNFRAEAEYRKTLAKVYIQRGLTEVLHHEH